jgi:hypothetical protein
MGEMKVNDIRTQQTAYSLITMLHGHFVHFVV